MASFALAEPSWRLVLRFPSDEEGRRKIFLDWRNKITTRLVYLVMNTKTQRFNVIGQLATLRRYALSLARNPDDAEDLVHDALVKAYERQVTFRSGANIRNWLLSIVHNTHIDRIRQSRSQRRRNDAVADITDEAAAPPQEHSVRLAQVRAAFMDLPEEQREALHLVAIEELSYQEAASVLGIPVGTLMSRISRARAQLRAIEETDPASRRGHLKLIGGKRDDDQ